MTLFVLLIIITTIALFVTLLNGLVFHKITNWPLSFLQAFSGVFFLFSGFVKAIDPLGTTYKMVDYFNAFSKHLASTPFSFLDGFWAYLAAHGETVSIVMIVLELVIGFMLLIGAKRRIVSWIFLILVAFFTILTGFTYLTGYVPQDATFFSFSEWGEWVDTQMEVSDCGCFGDFLKLEPFTSFMKDVFLLIPGLLFVIFNQKMYQWGTKSIRLFSTLGFTVLTAVFSVYNTKMNLPVFDFRPFAEGVDVRTTKEIEEEAMNEVQVIGYKLTNTLTNEQKELTMDEFLKDFKKYPKSEWDFTQIKTEPSIEPTKISDFFITGPENSDLAEAMLSDPEFNLWVISPVMTPEGREKRTESYVATDTALVETDTGMTKVISQVPGERETDYYVWSEDFLEKYRRKVIPARDAMQELGYNTYVAAGGAGQEAIEDFQTDLEEDLEMGTADEILLKTIIRSNPGFLLVKDGIIIKKWHYKKFTVEKLRKSIEENRNNAE